MSCQLRCGLLVTVEYMLSTDLLDPLNALLACCCSLPVCKTRLGLSYSEPCAAFPFVFVATSSMLVETGLMRFC